MFTRVLKLTDGLKSFDKLTFLEESHLAFK